MTRKKDYDVLKDTICKDKVPDIVCIALALLNIAESLAVIADKLPECDNESEDMKVEQGEV